MLYHDYDMQSYIKISCQTHWLSILFDKKLAFISLLTDQWVAPFAWYKFYIVQCINISDESSLPCLPSMILKQLFLSLESYIIRIRLKQCKTYLFTKYCVWAAITFPCYHYERQLQNDTLQNHYVMILVQPQSDHMTTAGYTWVNKFTMNTVTHDQERWMNAQMEVPTPRHDIMCSAMH